MDHGIKEILLTDEVVDAIDDHIDFAEEHIELAREYLHHPEMSAMFAKHAEMQLGMAEEKARIKHMHIERHKAQHATNPCCKHAHDLWCVKHPELCKNIDEAKFKLSEHKKRSMGGGNPY